ncbi:MAG TPA: hypothetical protein VLE89_06335 [Chlamydiales bacterium]|nr:hypothetical protein [Chlamydiales bacterium]
MSSFAVPNLAAFSANTPVAAPTPSPIGTPARPANLRAMLLSLPLDAVPRKISFNKESSGPEEQESPLALTHSLTSRSKVHPSAPTVSKPVTQKPSTQLQTFGFPEEQKTAKIFDRTVRDPRRGLTRSRGTPLARSNGLSPQPNLLTPTAARYQKGLSRALDNAPNERIFASQVGATHKGPPILKPLSLPQKPVTVLDALWPSQENEDYHLLDSSKEGCLAVIMSDGLYIKSKNGEESFGDYNSDQNVATSVAFDPAQPNNLIVGTKNGRVDYWNIRTKKKIFSTELSARAGEVNVVYSSKGHIYAGTSTGRLYELTQEGKATQKGHPFKGKVSALTASPNGQYLLATGQNDARNFTAHLYKFDANSASYQPYDEIRMKGSTVGLRAMAFSPDGQYFSLGTADSTFSGSILIYKIENGIAKVLERTLDSSITNLFWPNRNTILTTHRDGTIQSQLTDLDDMITSDLVGGHNETIPFATLTTSDQGTTLVTASSEGVKIWNMGRPQKTNKPPTQNLFVQGIR